METTSHFVGISLNADALLDTYAHCQKYIKQSNLGHAVEFQAPQTPHITLFYGIKDIESDIKNRVIACLHGLQIMGQIRINGYDYLEKKSQKSVLYLQPDTNLDLEKISSKLKDRFSCIGADENNLPFVPHISLMKILKPNTFEYKRAGLENILDEEMETLATVKSFSSNKAHLYAVNSNFSPDVQLIQEPTSSI